MKPRHKDWSIQRALARAQTLSRDIDRGHWRERSAIELDREARHLGRIQQALSLIDGIDVRVVGPATTEADGKKVASCEFRCLNCGGPSIHVPDDAVDDTPVHCTACGQVFGPHAAMMGLCHFLVLSEADQMAKRLWRPPSAGAVT